MRLISVGRIQLTWCENHRNIWHKLIIKKPNISIPLPDLQSLTGKIRPKKAIRNLTALELGKT
ncbi:MAG TPA: hypothetical protein DCS91_23045 [Microcoleaceae bacterium UBA11344]|nr:hypothetical protein [Microcoleaceae cyanobacterium UBA11344]